MVTWEESVYFFLACLQEKALSFDVKIAYSGVVESSVCPPRSGDQMKEPWMKMPPRVLPEWPGLGLDTGQRKPVGKPILLR